MFPLLFYIWDCMVLNIFFIFMHLNKKFPIINCPWLIRDLLSNLCHISAPNVENFYVLGSNLSLPTSSPGAMTGSGYHLCGRYSGIPPAGELSKVTCQPQPVTARFVYWQVDRSESPKPLELCEVWVYASKFIKQLNKCKTLQANI